MCCLFITIYHFDNGVHVADSQHDVPLSSAFHVKQTPIIDANLSWLERLLYWNALKKFPTSKHCTNQGVSEEFDASKFNWKQIYTNAQLQVCLHHLASELIDVDHIVLWLKKEGFDAYLIDTASAPTTSLAGTWAKTDIEQFHPFSRFSTWGMGSLIARVTQIPSSCSLNMLFDRKEGTLLHSNSTVSVNF